MISSQQNVSLGQDCKGTLVKAGKLSLPGKAAVPVDDTGMDRGITIGCAGKMRGWRGSSFHGFHR